MGTTIGNPSFWMSLCLGILATGAGCADIVGVGPLATGGAAAAGGQGGSGAGATSTTGQTGGGATGGIGGGATGGTGGSGGIATGGTGGAPPVCGNKIAEDGEYCDDGNDVQGDGCHECQRDCGCTGCAAGAACASCPASGQTTFKDLASGHCYVYDSSATTWDAAHLSCLALGEKWDLVAASTTAEMDVLMNAPGMPIDDHLANTANRIWSGGTDLVLEGTFVWSNGEPWNNPPVGLGLESVVAADDCLVLGKTSGLPVTLRGRPCSDSFQFACEHTP